jgi:predicted MPP superfamily phosphohydrolase
MEAIKYTLFGLLGIAVFALAWGLIKPYFIDTEEQVAEIPGLPAAWDGKRVGVISDWQIGMWLDNTWTMRRSVNLLVEKRPEVVLITGDFVYGPSDAQDEDIRKVGEFVRPLAEADIPTYAVLGNHDYRMAWPDSEPNSRAAGLAEDERLHLVGIGARWPNEAKPDVALSQVPDGASRFVMMHNPNSFGAFPVGTAPLAVAGHTHGGQISMPGMPEWSWIAYFTGEEVHADGWIEGYGRAGNRLYVNRGIGFSTVPIRLHCMPEAPLFTLRPA